MDHLVSHVVGKMFLQFRMAFEERQVALIGDAVEIVNLSDEPVPILPKDFDCLHRQRAIGHVRMKTSFEQPAVGNIHQMFFKISDHRVGFLR